MKVAFWYIGKTNEAYIKTGAEIFKKRLSHYCNFEELLIKDVKPGQTSAETKLRESDQVLGKLQSSDYLILLDENGKQMSSVQFAAQLEKLQMQSSKRIIFLVAGAFGAHENLKQRANMKLSLSSMTFSHQMIRVFFLEQLYRAFTIIRNEKYHNA